VRRPQGRRILFPSSRERGADTVWSLDGAGGSPDLAGGLTAISRGEPGPGPAGLKATSPKGEASAPDPPAFRRCALCRPVSSAADPEPAPLPVPHGRTIAG